MRVYVPRMRASDDAAATAVGDADVFVADQSEATAASDTRVSDALLERLARIEAGLGFLGTYLGQRAEELPAGSEVGAELELAPAAGDPVAAAGGLRLLKCYEGRFHRSSDLFMVEAPEETPPASVLPGCPEVVATGGGQLLVDLSRGAESERGLAPLLHLFRVVQRSVSRGPRGPAHPGHPGALPHALEVHTLPTYAREVARKLLEEGVEPAARECGASARHLVRFFCRKVHAESDEAVFPHPLSDVWPEMPSS